MYMPAYRWVAIHRSLGEAPAESGELQTASSCVDAQTKG